MCKKNYKAINILVLLALMFLVASKALSSQDNESKAGAEIARNFAGKTVWVVDVNTNEYYKSTFQLALVDQLQRFAPGVIVRHITTGEKGNPFFLLNQEDYPDAVIVSLGVCGQTGKKVANYTSEARKKGIPSVLCYIVDAREDQLKWNEAYRNPVELSIEIEKIPQTRQEAMQIAIKSLPVFLEQLMR